MSTLRLVSAGAGSGKTWRIVEELVDRVAGGVSLDRIAAVTFTEAAASELQERLRAGLQRRGLTAEAAGVERANVCTIHRFALTLLRRYPLPAALPPDPMVLEQDEARALFRRSLQSVLRGAELAIDDDLAQLVEALVEKARSLGMGADELARQAPAAVACVTDVLPPSADADATDADFRHALDAAFAWLGRGQTRSTDEGIRRELRSLRRDGPTFALDAAQRVLRAPAPSKTFAKELPALLPAAHAMALRHPAARDRIASIVEEAFQLAVDALREYAESRHRLGALDFEEMQLRAVQLLTGDGRDDRYARAVAAELPYVVVDEFQDSSPLQFRLFEVLRAAGTEVCYVGDLKQAIYGFRGADSSLFSALLSRASAVGPAPEVLDRSRRSRPELVRFANALFSVALPAVGVPFDALTADNDYTRLGLAESADAVEILRVPASTRSGPRIELGARRIRALLDSDLTVLDRVTRAPRRVRPGDVAVLGRQRSQLGQWADALRTLGLAVHQESDGLFETLEVRLTRAWLSMLASPRDRSAAAMVLLSELYGLRQSTVAALSVEKVSGSPRRALELAASAPARLTLIPFEERALQRCDADLRACRDALRSLPLGEAVEAAVERVALVDRLSLRCDPAEAAQLRANVGWIIAEAHTLSGRRDHALSLGEATGATLENLLHHLQARSFERLRQPVAPHDDVDAVRLMCSPSSGCAPPASMSSAPPTFSPPTRSDTLPCDVSPTRAFPPSMRSCASALATSTRSYARRCACSTSASPGRVTTCSSPGPRPLPAAPASSCATRSPARCPSSPPPPPTAAPRRGSTSPCASSPPTIVPRPSPRPPSRPLISRRGARWSTTLRPAMPRRHRAPPSRNSRGSPRRTSARSPTAPR